jgi:hypothetical protein
VLLASTVGLLEVVPSCGGANDGVGVVDVALTGVGDGDPESVPGVG